MCIGVGGDNQIKKSSVDNKYWAGKVKFGKTTYYKKRKKNSHWMRIRASKKQSETSTETSNETTTEDSMTTVDSAEEYGRNVCGFEGFEGFATQIGRQKM